LGVTGLSEGNGVQLADEGRVHEIDLRAIHKPLTHLREQYLGVLLGYNGLREQEVGDVGEHEEDVLLEPRIVVYSQLVVALSVGEAVVGSLVEASHEILDFILRRLEELEEVFFVGMVPGLVLEQLEDNPTQSTRVPVARTHLAKDEPHTFNVAHLHLAGRSLREVEIVKPFDLL
jgi:hypothetical protein